MLYSGSEQRYGYSRPDEVEKPDHSLYVGADIRVYHLWLGYWRQSAVLQLGRGTIVDNGTRTYHIQVQPSTSAASIQSFKLRELIGRYRST